MTKSEDEMLCVESNWLTVAMPSANTFFNAASESAERF